MMPQRGKISPLSVALWVLLPVLSFYGCSTKSRHRIADIIFEGKPSQERVKPKPVVRKPRRSAAYKKKPEVKKTPIDPRVMARNELFQRDWNVFMRALPKDPTGRVNWVSALDNGQIQPAPGLASNAVDLPVLPLEVVLEPEAQPLFKAVFPHRTHTQWLTCNNCHMQIFQMQKGADPISMTSIFAGKYCGVCHGKVAFDVSTACARCHPVLRGPR